MFKDFQKTFTFDDVLLVPQKSDVLPRAASLVSKLTKDIKLNLPFLSAAMDTITEHKMAIAMALAGGLGVIHKNLTIAEQVAEVNIVKRFENGFVEVPITISPEDKIERVAEIRKTHGYKKIPVVDKDGVLVGLISDVDYFVPDDAKLLVKFRMKPLKEMVVGEASMSLEKANKMIRVHRLKTLCVVDRRGKLTSIVSRRDMEKNELYPNANKNSLKQLRVGAAISVSQPAMARAEALVEAGVDALVIDTAHGHSRSVIETVRQIKKKFKSQAVVVGNIVTAEAARELVSAGADALKVGIGPGSICTTRVISGVGLPQLSAIITVVEAVRATGKNIPVIADGGIRNSGDVVKALAAGANAVMMGNMLAGTDETPGRVEFVGGKMFKIYRGMGSLEAMERGGKDRYGQSHIEEKKKFVPEGVSGKVIYKGPVERILYQLAGGLRSGLGYCGAGSIVELQKKAKFISISSAGLKESHPHDLPQMESAPNYDKG